MHYYNLAKDQERILTQIVVGGLDAIDIKAVENFDYVSITLTDDKETYHQKEQLEEIYDHILEIMVDNARTRKLLEQMSGEEKLEAKKTALEQLAEKQQQLQEQITLIKIHCLHMSRLPSRSRRGY